MTMFNLLAAFAFTEFQIVIIVLLSVFLVAAIVGNVLLINYFRKKNERKLCTHQLQKRREELLQRLEDMRNGGELPDDEDNEPSEQSVEQEEVKAEVDEIAEAAAQEEPAEEIPAAPVAVSPVVDEDEEDDDDDDEEESASVVAPVLSEEGAEQAPVYEILAVKDMSANMREKLGFSGSEYDRKRYFVRYMYSFDAKLRASSSEVQNRYSAFVNEISQYKGVKIRDSFRQQRISKGRKTLGLIVIRGKTLCVALALNPADYADTKYRGVDKSDKKRFKMTPMLLKITSDRKAEYAKYLFVQVADLNTITLSNKPVEPEYDFSQMTNNELYDCGKLRIQVISEAPESDGEVVEVKVEQVVEEQITEQPVTEEPVEAAAEQPIEQAIEVKEQVVEEQTTEQPVTDESVEESAEEPDEEVVALEELSESEDAEEIEEIIADENEDVEIIEEEAFGGITIRYNRSFQARLIQASDEVKARYSAIKNHILSYKKVSSRMSWKKEGFRLSRTTFALISVRGKTLCVSFAAQPARFEGTKYKIIDKSVRNPNCKQPSLLRVNSNRKVKYAIEIVDMLMADMGASVKTDYVAENYSPEYEITQTLIERGLIKIVGDRSDALFTVTDSVADEVAADSVVESEPIAEPEHAEETVEQIVEEPVESEELVQETVEATVEQVIEEPAQEPIDEPAESEEPVQETFEETVEQVIEEPAEEPIDEPVGGEEPAQEAVEETVEQIIEEPAEEPAESEEPEEEGISEQEAEVQMSDDDARSHVEVVKKSKNKGGKSAVVNIHVLSTHFAAGETVNLDSLRKKKLISKNTGAVKILAKGKLNKPLIVEADDFSLQAVKMIVLTGGRAIRTKNY